MTLNTAVTNNDFDYVRDNEYTLHWDINKPMHISTIEMCNLLTKFGYSASRVLSCVTNAELFDYLVCKLRVHVTYYATWLPINNHTTVILRWIEHFPELFINRDQKWWNDWYYIAQAWLNCDRCVLIALNNLDRQIQFTLQIAIIDNTTLIGTLHVRKLDYEMYKSFYDLCTLVNFEFL
jgi:hypothetical protein